MSRNMRVIIENIEEPAGVCIDSHDMAEVISFLCDVASPTTGAIIEFPNGDGCRVDVGDPEAVKALVESMTLEQIVKIMTDEIGVEATYGDLDAAAENIKAILGELSPSAENYYTYIEIDS